MIKCNDGSNEHEIVHRSSAQSWRTQFKSSKDSSKWVVIHLCVSCWLDHPSKVPFDNQRKVDAIDKPFEIPFDQPFDSWRTWSTVWNTLWSTLWKLKTLCNRLKYPVIYPLVVDRPNQCSEIPSDQLSGDWRTWSMFRNTSWSTLTWLINSNNVLEYPLINYYVRLNAWVLNF